MRVGIVGIGGLGQMGVRIASAMGNEVTAISRGTGEERFRLGDFRFRILHYS